jgi:hypothetical protein
LIASPPQPEAYACTSSSSPLPTSHRSRATDIPALDPRISGMLLGDIRCTELCGSGTGCGHELGTKAWFKARGLGLTCRHALVALALALRRDGDGADAGDSNRSLVPESCWEDVTCRGIQVKRALCATWYEFR